MNYYINTETQKTEFIRCKCGAKLMKASVVIGTFKCRSCGKYVDVLHINGETTCKISSKTACTD